ncbi:MAG: amidohydrolase family protein [bacterium]
MIKKRFSLSNLIRHHRRSAIVLTFAVLLIMSTSISAQTTPAMGIRSKTPDARAFTNARIVISPDLVYDNATLVIKNGKVLDVGDRITIPDDIITIDLQGKTIYPGFIDPFTEYGVKKTDPPKRRHGRAPQYEGTRVGANAWNNAIHAEKNWAESFKPDEKESKKLMELGFAAVHTAGQDGIYRGRSCVVLLGEGLPNDLLIRPYGYHVASFDKGTSTQDYPDSWMGAIALIRQTLYDVDWYQKAHRACQLDPGQKMPEFNVAIEALVGLKDERLLFDGGTRELSLYRTVAIAREFDLSLVHVANGYEYTHVDDVKQTGVTLILPLVYPEKPSLKVLEDDFNITLGQLRHWETAPSNAARLEHAGVTFALTTHRLKNKADFFKNLRTAIKRGLSEKTALSALTTVAAEVCGVSDMLGTLEIGKLANFFICDGDIFEDDVEIYSVWAAGNQHQLKPLPVTEFHGEYELSVNELSMTLTLIEKPDALKGEIKHDDFSRKLKNLESDRNRIAFATAFDSSKTAGLARFSGRKAGDTISGRCQLADGRTVDWQAVRTGPVPSKEDSTEESSQEPDSLIARLTYPNRAFGRESPPAKQDVLIKNATVWTVEEVGIRENCDILVKDGKFEKIEPDLIAPTGISVIDAGGKHITPGIIDAHSHLAISGDVNEGTLALTPEVRIGDVVNPLDINIYRQLAGGVTTCLTLHGSANPIGGQCQTLKLRWGTDAEELKFKDAAPTIKFALGENVKQCNWGDQFRTRYPQSRMGVKTIIKDEFKTAREYEAAWKKYNALNKKQKEKTVPPRKDLGLDAILEVLNSQCLLHCHAYMQAEMLMMIRLAEEFGFTLDCFVHGLEAYKIADELARHGATVTSFSDWWAYKFEVYDAIPYNVNLLAERGVVTSVNSDDADLARRLNQEAAKSVMYGGMTQQEAIKLVTINSAIQLGVEDRVGSITVGKDADFVIWSDNPLSIYAVAEQTWIDGCKYFDLQEDSIMRQAVQQERNALIQKALGGQDETSEKKNGDRKKPKPDPDDPGFGDGVLGRNK